MHAGLLLTWLGLLLGCCVATHGHNNDDKGNPAPSVYKDSKKYGYVGCYNETTEVGDAPRTRALFGGINDSHEEMTVPMCLKLCNNGDHKFKYAGLEWAKECWCANTLSDIAMKLDDGQCDFPCQGDSSLACGGSLKLSVYKRSRAVRRPASSVWLLAACVLVSLIL